MCVCVPVGVCVLVPVLPKVSVINRRLSSLVGMEFHKEVFVRVCVSSEMIDRVKKKTRKESRAVVRLQLRTVTLSLCWCQEKPVSPDTSQANLKPRVHINSVCLGVWGCVWCVLVRSDDASVAANGEIPLVLLKWLPAERNHLKNVKHFRILLKGN